MACLALLIYLSLYQHISISISISIIIYIYIIYIYNINTIYIISILYIYISISIYIISIIYIVFIRLQNRRDFRSEVCSSATRRRSVVSPSCRAAGNPPGEALHGGQKIRQGLVVGMVKWMI